MALDKCVLANAQLVKLRDKGIGFLACTSASRDSPDRHTKSMPDMGAAVLISSIE